MTPAWNDQRSYRAGERVKWYGDLFEARFDLCRGIKPTGTLSEKFWRRLPRLPRSLKSRAFIR